MNEIYLDDLDDSGILYQEMVNYIRKYRPDIAAKMDDEDNEQRILVATGLPHDEMCLI